MTREERERIARNLAEVIDDLYSEHAKDPRTAIRRVELVAKQISRAMYLGWKSKQALDNEDDE